MVDPVLLLFEYCVSQLPFKGTDAFCICEAGYINNDCSLQTCPKGDDPLTEGQAHRKITITTSAWDGSLTGHFDFTFMGQSVGFDAQPSTTSMK
jgi:hypothetical protein